MHGFVDLKRNFVPIGENAEPELAIGRTWGRRYGGWLDWPDVLDHKRVVLLAEAQSGKTEEFMHAAAVLRGRGCSAFYATIEQLADGRFVLSPDELALFSAWKNGHEPAWFFLDSVDEARLNRKKFDDALRHFTLKIGTALERVTVLVSCRVSDWKGKSDHRTILDLLPIPKPVPNPAPVVDPDAALLDPVFEREDSEESKKDEKKKPDLLVVQLVPLTDEQRRIFALGNGVHDVDAFLNAIERQGLDVLAERPGDMLELVRYWALHKSFGTLTAMTEAAVAAKLTETDRYRPDNTTLALAKAREGAERLAATLTLAKTLTLVAPGQELDPTLSSGALDPASILNDWTLAESNALLRRGIFAPSTYGRVRFHHRSTQEYLTACWLKRLLDNGCPRSEIFDLFFAERYGVETVVPSLRSAAAWLAHYFPDIRDEIIRREPLLLITHGDPAGLSTENKTKVLLNLASKHAAGDIADDSIDRRALGMFGAPDLSEAIHEAWKINTRPDFRIDLIRLVREARIKGCISLAADMAGDTKERDYHRIAAIDALVACDADAELRQIATKLTFKPSNVGARLAAGSARALFPKYLSVVQLLNLIDKAKPPSSNAIEGFAYNIEELWHACPAADRPTMVAGLASICARPPFVHEYRRVAARQEQLSRYLGGIAHEVLSASGTAVPPAMLINLLAVVERAERAVRTDDDLPPLGELVRQTTTVNRALFWNDVEEERKNSKHAVTGWWHVHFGGSPLWQLNTDDLPWLREDLRTKTLHDDRRVALSAIANVVQSQLKAEAPSLRKLIGKDPTLHKELNSYLRPPKPSADIRRMNREEAKSKEKRKVQRARAEASWREFRDKLKASPAVISDPSKGFPYLHNLCEWLHRKTRKDYAEAVREWHLLEPAFSKEVAEAYHDGMKALWRVSVPERPTRTLGGPVTVKWITIYSYAAIGIEAAENPRFAEILSDSDVRRAVQHVCLSEQGYPDWLDGLIAMRPKIAVPFVQEAFQYEWIAEEGRVSYFLYHFAQNTTAINVDMQSAIFDVISTREPKQLNTFDRGLDIIRKLTLSDAQRAVLRASATAQFNAYKKSRPYWAARYLAILFLLDPAAAAATLIAWLRKEKPGKRKAIAVTFLGLLFGGHDSLVADALKRMPIETLSQLVLFAYQEVRPDNDNVHEGAYTPNDRDDAENARSTILKALVDNEGAAAFEAMMRISERRDMKARRIRFRELARRMAERDADVSAWRSEDILAFEHDKILPVKCAPQLHKVVRDVLNEISWDFDNADASSRSVLETARDEDAVQEWLAAEIKHRAKGRYHVARESEIAEGNKPDILISAIGLDAEVSVEAKHGGKGWSTNELEGSLRHQLAEDYLRPSTRRHGIFVITNHQNRRWAHPKTRKHLSFADLIAYLDGVATTLKKYSTGDITVKVIGIDATKKPRKRAYTKNNKVQPSKI